MSLSALSADAAGQLDVFGHDGDSLGVDGAQVGVLKQTDQISLAGLLQGHDSGALEAQVRLEVLSDFSHQTLEGQLADQQLGGLLIATDLSQSHGAGPVAMRLLDAAGGRSALTGGFGSELLPLPPVDLRAVCLVLAIAAMYFFLSSASVENVAALLLLLLLLPFFGALHSLCISPPTFAVMQS